MNYNYDREVNASEIWDYLVMLAEDKANGSITYGELGSLIGIHYRSLRYPLDTIFKYCESNDLPLLTVLVHDRNGDVGDGFTSATDKTVDQIIDEVYDKGWKNINNPFAAAVNKKSIKAATKAILAGDSQGVTKALGDDRGSIQRAFRNALLKTQGNKCPISGLTFHTEACHVKPWSECDEISEKVDLSNGILMAPHVHKMFDEFYFTIYPVNDKAGTFKCAYYDSEDGDYTQADQHMVLLIKNCTFELPQITDFSYLQWHNSEFERTNA